MKKLKQAFQEAQRAISEITDNWTFQNITEDELEAIDTAAKKDGYVAKQRSHALGLLANLPADHTNQHDNLLEAISETVVYLELKDRLSLSRFAEGDEPRPDFSIGGPGPDRFMEVKAIAMAGGLTNKRRYQEDALQGQIALRTQREAGEKVALHERVIAPMDDGKPGYQGNSTSHWVSVVVRKLESNIKLGQFEHGRTILAVDLRQQLLIAHLEDSTKRYWKDMYGAQVSGELWHTCFGCKDQEMFRPAEWEDENNRDPKLPVQGILVSYPSIAAACFRYSALGGTPRYVGFARGSDGWTRQVLNAFCTTVQLEDD